MHFREGIYNPGNFRDYIKDQILGQKRGLFEKISIFFGKKGDQILGQKRGIFKKFSNLHFRIPKFSIPIPGLQITNPESRRIQPPYPLVQQHTTKCITYSAM